MISSDSQAGRGGYLEDFEDCGEDEAGEGEGVPDNARVKRYVAKYTTIPAISHTSPDRSRKVYLLILAFGDLPTSEIVVKGGSIAFARLGEADAFIPTVQPVYGKPMFRPNGASVTFVSKTSSDSFVDKEGRKRRYKGVKKSDM
ncbi:hypothetical protein PQX77_014443 [Marasmius sp. AFHP31]|nr:hypothetical protein PQX77_014443 [Marasmius sp. AFHP31]